jgi:hypothetical protein
MGLPKTTFGRIEAQLSSLNKNASSNTLCAHAGACATTGGCQGAGLLQYTLMTMREFIPEEHGVTLSASLNKPAAAIVVVMDQGGNNQLAMN